MNDIFVCSSEAAKYFGLHPNTLRKRAKSGKIEYYRTTGGHFRYKITENEPSESSIICYCRVSSVKQKDDLVRQVARMRLEFPDACIIQDVGSGLNFKRKGIKTLLERILRGDKFTLIITHRDRLVRFGYELFAFLIKRNGGEIMVLDGVMGSAEAELADDILAILHVFSCRMHGKRSHQNKKNKIKAEQGTESNI